MKLVKRNSPLTITKFITSYHKGVLEDPTATA